MASSGAIQFAAAYGGYLWRSNAYGASWVNLNTTAQHWQTIACSSDGTYAVAGVWYGYIYTSSNTRKHLGLPKPHLASLGQRHGLQCRRLPGCLCLGGLHLDIKQFRLVLDEADGLGLQEVGVDRVGRRLLFPGGLRRHTGVHLP